MSVFFALELGWYTIFTLSLLVGCLLVSLAIALFHIYRYNGTGSFPGLFIWSENESLKKVEEEVSTAKVLLTPGEVFDSDVLEKIKETANSRSLIYDRLETIINLQKSYARIDLDVLQANTQTKESASRTLEIPGYFVGFAMLIGLLGTIVGLSIMIGDMQEAFKLQQPATIDVLDKTREKVQEVLGSMQSAFWTTIGGLFCSIVSSLVNYFMHISQARFYKRLDTFTVEELLPLVFRSKETSDLLKDANENIEKTFSKLQNIGQGITDNTQKLNAVHQSFHTIISNLERITQNPLRNEMQQILQQLSQVIAETAKTNQSVQNTVEYIPRVIELMEKNNHQSPGVFEQASQENQKTQETSTNFSFPSLNKIKPLENWKTQPPNPGQSSKESRKIRAFKLLDKPSSIIISASVLGIVVLFFIVWFLSY
jgi:biopolymer transport protein ExbB/TolQ